MKHTAALKQNYEFRRLYSKGKSAVSPFVAVYCRKNRLGYSRLGITTGVKLGKAVRRNQVRRRLREAYRLHEAELIPGYDLVVVARMRAVRASYRELEHSLLRCADKLGLRRREGSE